MTLTDLQVRKMAPKPERFEVLDANGLYIRVMPTGKKSWIFRYNFEGNPRRLTLGAYPAVTLAEAREKHALASQNIVKGIDPGVKKQEEKAKRKAAPTFQDILDEFWEIELHVKKSGLQTKKLLEKNALPVWNKKKVADIKRRDIVLLLDGIRARAPIVGNRVHGALSRLFNFAAERGVIDDSPCTRIKKIKEISRKRVLSDDEIKILWAALDIENIKVDIYRLSKLALKMILLTGQRPGEVAGMTWAEIKKDLWILPADRTKNGEENRVPLNPMALEVIEHARDYSGDSHYVFRSSYKSDTAMNRHSLSRAISRHWLEIGFQEAFTPHDLRRTLRTRLADLGVTDVVAERVMGHKLQGVLEVYNRYSYDTEKRQALLLWEQWLHEILGFSKPVSNIIQFGVRRG
ncbi:MAG: tyrosine-type recombinase/integrase [Desulfatirhabdiaceae bacterium]